MITPIEYLMGRDKEYPLDLVQSRNMADLLARVNWLFSSINFNAKVSSGYRPGHYNKSIGGAKMSTHTMCAGIDVIDPEGKYSRFLRINPLILSECGLWMENPDFTWKIGPKGENIFWLHLDIKKRSNIVFNP